MRIKYIYNCFIGMPRAQHLGTSSEKSVHSISVHSIHHHIKKEYIKKKEHGYVVCHVDSTAQMYEDIDFSEFLPPTLHAAPGAAVIAPPSSDIVPATPLDIGSAPPLDIGPAPPLDIVPAPPFDIGPAPPFDIVPASMSTCALLPAAEFSSKRITSETAIRQIGQSAGSRRRT